MRKLFILGLMIFSLVVSGCAQQASNNGAAAGGTGGGGPASATPSQPADEKPNPPASKFPERPIQMIVPYAAGSSTEMIARILADGVQKYMPNGQSVVVVNKPGGSGTIGTTEVFRAKPDGYTIGIVTNNQLSIQPHYGNTVYSHDSFQPVMKVSIVPQLLAVKADAPWQTFEEWLEYAKNNPNDFTYATVGAGSTVHISVEAVNIAAGIQTKAVHFESGAEQVTSLLGGHVKGASLLPQTAHQYVKSGDIRILVNLGSYKPEAYKEVPLASEVGVNSTPVDIVTGIVAPKGIPEETLKVLHDAFKQTLEDPEIQEKLKALDVNPTYAGPEDYQKEITQAYNDYGDILRAIGMIK